MPDALGEPCQEGWVETFSSTRLPEHLVERWRKLSRERKLLLCCAIILLLLVGLTARWTHGPSYVFLLQFVGQIAPFALRKKEHLSEKDRYDFVHGTDASVKFEVGGKFIGSDQGELWAADGMLKFVGDTCEFAIPNQLLSKLPEIEQAEFYAPEKKFSFTFPTEKGDYVVSLKLKRVSGRNAATSILEAWHSGKLTGRAVLPPMGPSLGDVMTRRLSGVFSLGILCAGLTALSIVASGWNAYVGICIGLLAYALYRRGRTVDRKLLDEYHAERSPSSAQIAAPLTLSSRGLSIETSA